MHGRFTISHSTTVGELIAWSYANLAMAHAAVAEEAPYYNAKHYAIRARLHKGLLVGSFLMGSTADEERLKMILPQTCSYCGDSKNLSLDHLIPRCKGGSDHGENLIWACRSCNSSKRDADALAWFARKGEFPPLFLLRRYLKLVHEYCQDRGLLGALVESLESTPFCRSSIPIQFPGPSSLRLWVRGVKTHET